MSDRFVFVDIETTGLSELTDVVLEVGIIIATPELEVIDEFDVTIWESPYYDRKLGEMEILAKSGNKSARYVLDMHTDNGLWNNAQEEGATVAEAETQLIDFLKGHGVPNQSIPMAGSSVHFDRKMLAVGMPAFTRCFSHRNIDVSSIKELCKTISPALYSRLDKYGPPKNEKHRTLADLRDTMGELQWYIDNFLWTSLDEVAN